MYFSLFLPSTFRVPPGFFLSFTATATSVIYTLSLHDALPIFFDLINGVQIRRTGRLRAQRNRGHDQQENQQRSEEHTSELQSLTNLVCRLLLEKKKTQSTSQNQTAKNLHGGRTSGQDVTRTHA